MFGKEILHFPTGQRRLCGRLQILSSILRTWVRVPLYTGLYLSQPEQANVLIEYILLIECGSRESLSGINQRRNLQKIFVELDENLKKIANFS